MRSPQEVLLDRVNRLPRFKGQSRLLRWLMRITPMARSRYGPRMCARGGDWTSEMALRGRYGDELPERIRALPRDGVFIDIGANQGIFSLIASAHLTEGSVVAFEPNPQVFAALLSNMAINGCHNVLALHGAVGREVDLVQMSVEEGHSGVGHLQRGALTGEQLGALKGEKRGAPMGDAARTAVVFGPQLLEKIAARVAGRTVLCKIDTEGFELEVLQALAAGGLLRQVDSFFVEIDDANLARFGAGAEAVYALMAESGFDADRRRAGQGHYDEVFRRRPVRDDAVASPAAPDRAAAQDAASADEEMRVPS